LAAEPGSAGLVNNTFIVFLGNGDPAIHYFLSDAGLIAAKVLIFIGRVEI
jgi:hypothetical protein